MKLAPMWHWRAQYSLGCSAIFSTTGRPHSCSCDPTALRMRSKKKSSEPRKSGTHPVPCSVNTNCRSG